MQQDVHCGLNAVTALFRRRPGDVARLFYTAEARHLAGPFCAELARAKKPYRELPPADMAKAAGTTHHGGLAAVAAARKIPFMDEAPDGVSLLLVLDRIGNPHNLGAIARSAAFFGVRALLLTELPGAAMLSDAAYRTAEGALEYLDIYRTRDLPRVLTAIGPRFRTVATTLRREAAPFTSLPRDRPLALVLGNEEHGVSREVIAACRREVRIDGAGDIQSLNVAQAAAILLHAFTAPA